MSLSHVEIKWFKSIKNLEIDFIDPKISQSFNLIVGPNGSGKSNILDAIYFGLGVSKKHWRLPNIESIRHKSLDQDVSTTTMNKVLHNPIVKLLLKNFDGEQKEIITQLSPNNSIIHKINGRQKSTKELRESLLQFGINVSEPNSFMVMQTSVSNIPFLSSFQLAEIISSSAGTKEYSLHARNCLNEIQKFQTSKRQIKNNISSLELVISRERQQFNSEHKQQELKSQISEFQNKLNRYEIMKTKSEIAEKNQSIERLKNQIQTLENSESNLNKQQKQQQVDEQKDQNDLNTTESLLTQQKQDIRSMENQLLRNKELEKIRKQTIQKRKSLSTQLEQFQSEEKTISFKLQTLESDINSRQETLKRSLSSTNNKKPNREELRNELKSLKFSQQPKISEIVNGKKNLVQQLENEHDEIQQKISGFDFSTFENGSHFLSSSTTINSQMCSKITSSISLRKQQVEQKQQQLLEQKSRQQTHSQSLCSHSNRSNFANVFGCFRFKPTFSSEFLSTLKIAISCLANNSQMSFVVTPTTENALEVLREDSNPVVIWSLDRISATTKQTRFFSQQQQKQQTGTNFKEGDVIDPFDIFEATSSKSQPIISKLFGNWVVSRNQSVAEELISKFKQPSVTLDGTKNFGSTMIGGFDVKSHHQIQNSSNPMDWFSLKLKQHEIDQQLQKQKEILSSLDLKLQQSQKLQTLLEKRELVQEKQNIERNELSRFQVDLHSLNVRVELLEQQLNDSIANKEKRSGKESEMVDISAEFMSKLQKELEESQKQQKFLIDKRNTLTDSILDIEAQLNVIEMNIEEEEGEGEEQQKEPTEGFISNFELENRISILRNEFNESTKRFQLKQQHRKKFEQSKTQTEEKLIEIKRSLKSIQSKIANEQQELETLRKNLSENIQENEGENEGGEEEKQSFDVNVAEIQIQIQDLKKKLEKEKQISTSIQKSTNTQQLDLHSYQQKQTTLSEFKEQLLVLETSIENLLKGIENSRALITNANEKALSEIGKFQSQFFRSLVPTLDVKLVKVKTTNKTKPQKQQTKTIENDEDLEMEENENEHENENENGNENEKDEEIELDFGVEFIVLSESREATISQLSGGQASILGLSFLLACAKYSNSQGCLMLFDEVDAALDEQNSHSISMLIKKIYAEKGKQIICVSHHPTFQTHANRQIHVSKSNGNTIVSKVVDKK